VGRGVASVDVTDMTYLLSRGLCYQPLARILNLLSTRSSGFVDPQHLWRDTNG
jgi:hypothetical protein